MLCVGACWKGPGPGTGQGWPWTTGVTLQTVSCGLASLQVPISFRASLHLCYKEVSNCTNLGGDVFRMRKKSNSLFTKDGNSLPFSHLADAQILGNSLSAWRRGQEICSPGVRRSVLCVCNLSATTVISAFTPIFLPLILGSHSLSSEYIFALPTLRHGKSLLCLLLKFQHRASSSPKCCRRFQSLLNPAEQHEHH